MSHGPQHFESNNWQGKGCHSGDKKTLLAEADASKKRLMLVGGYADNAVDLCGEGNPDAKLPCLGKGQTMMTKQPRAELEECWSEAIIKCGLSPSVVDDPPFRKTLVTTVGK